MPRRLAALLVVFLVGAVPGGAQAPAKVYDAYVAGVRLAELTIAESGTRRTFSIRKKNPRSNAWASAVTAAQDAVGRDTAFALWGSIRNLPAHLADLGRINWPSLKAVGWPDANTIYVRHRELTEQVDGRSVDATRWAARDISRPMDLVVTSKNEIVAGVDLNADFVLVRRGYERFTTVARWKEPTVSAAKFGYRPLGKTMMPTADGTRLATLVYLPDGDITGPFPVVFIRTPYGIGTLINGYWHYAARGYALVFQATRGTSFGDPVHRSEGIWEPVIHEPSDGADALAWIAKQPWSNGKVCMQGGSYVAYTQWTASMSGNPILKCLIPESSMGTVFSDQPYMGGSFVEGMAFYMFWMLDTKILPNRTWTEILHHRPLMDLDNFATGKEIPQWNTMMEHQTNDEYWRRQDWYRSAGPRNIGAFMISGWFDDDFPGTESNWAMMQKAGSQPQRLVIGPWRHGYNVDRALNGYSFGTSAVREDIWLLKQKWYDHFLKGANTGITGRSVDYFVLGANEWRTATSWPPAEAELQKWYFHSDGEAARFSTSGSLTRTPPTATEPGDTYQYDPRNPPPNWMSFEQMQRWEDVQTYPWDFKDIEARPDVVTFTSAPLAEDVTIAGDVLAVLYASADVKDTDWWVHLSDVDEAGRSNRITNGMIRARFRKLDDPQHKISGSNFETEVLLSGNPQDVVRYEIGVRSIANRFKKGHRIRIAVMNALDNYSFPNSNTGENEALVTRTVVGTMTVHHSPDRASYVVLPVMR